METVLVFGAHSDDHVFGAGGTIANYAREGKKVVAIIFSYGESSHLWLQRKHSVKMRVREARKAGKLLGCETIFLGLKEGKFGKEIEEKNIKKRIIRLIKEKKPSKIFVHSLDDPHPDHRSVHDFILELLDDINYVCEVYAFDVWNPLNFRKRFSPKMFVNIDKTFKLKIRALLLFESQWLALLVLMASVYLRAIINGLSAECRSAERFYKIL